MIGHGSGIDGLILLIYGSKFVLRSRWYVHSDEPI